MKKMIKIRVMILVQSSRVKESSSGAYSKHNNMKN